jgi:hypothetical protein
MTANLGYGAIVILVLNPTVHQGHLGFCGFTGIRNMVHVWPVHGVTTILIDHLPVDKKCNKYSHWSVSKQKPDIEITTTILAGILDRMSTKTRGYLHVRVCMHRTRG